MLAVSLAAGMVNELGPDSEEMLQSSEWSMFLTCAWILYKLERDEDALRRLEDEARALPGQTRFKFKKSLDKLVKVDVAIGTLYALALSARRAEWVPRSGRAELLTKMRNVAGNSDMKIHSECQLVAWVAQNAATFDPDIFLVPYMACSKLHCFACSVWLEVYNALDGTSPKISYDGSRGGLKPGWAPPSLETNIQQEMIDKLVARFERCIPDPYAFSTYSDPSVHELPGPSQEDLDVQQKVLERMRCRLQRAAEGQRA
ncbi:hypothetical protein B0H11DRAFT_1970920 [Mycena galericulata]|nr:hypothetical protein B0H11DRAFT_1970920 [Mycena galericulata]